MRRREWAGREGRLMMSLGGYLGGGAGDRPKLRRFGSFFSHSRVVFCFLYAVGVGWLLMLWFGFWGRTRMNGSSSFLYFQWMSYDGFPAPRGFGIRDTKKGHQNGGTGGRTGLGAAKACFSDERDEKGCET